MADYLKLLETGTEAIGLKDDLELIQALAGLAENWAKLAGKLDGVDSAETLLTTFAGEMDNPAIKQAFETAGLTEVHGKLVRLLGKATDATGKLPEKYRKLLQPIALFNGPDSPADSGLVEWTLIDESRDFDAGKEFKFGLGGNAGIAFEAGDRPALAGAAAADPLLRLSAKAGVDAKAGATIPIKFGSIAGGAEGKLAVDLDYYFKTGPADSLYGLAVARRLPNLPNPFSYHGLWEAIESPDTGLSALVLRLTEETRANIDIALADAGAFGPEILADLSVTIGAAASLSRQYQLTFSAVRAAPGAAPQIRVTMARDMESERKLNAGFALGLDLTKLAGRVHEVLKRAVEKSDAVLAQITPYLKPGSYLQERLGGLIDAKAKSLISNEGLRGALVRDLRGAAGIDTAESSALEAWLTGRLTKAIDGAATELTEGAGALRDKALALLADPRIPAFAQADVRQAVTDAVDPLLAQVAAEFTGKLRSLIPDNLLGQALHKLGASASEQIANLDEALAPVRALIDRYNALLDQAVALAGDASRAKINARLQIEEAWQFGEHDRIVGTFAARSDAACAIYDDLTHGRLDALRQLVLNGSPTGDFQLDRAQSSIRRFAGRTSKVDYELVLFGFAVSGGVRLDGSATMLIDGDGRIQVDSRGEIERRFKSPNESREVSLVDTFSLVRAKAMAETPGDSRLIEMGVSIAHLDDSLKLEEMQGFVCSLEDAALLPAGTETAATAHFVAWAQSGEPRVALAADLAAKLWLTRAQAEKLMQLQSRDAEGLLSDQARLRILGTAADALTAAGARKIERVRDGADRIKEQYDVDLSQLGLAEFINWLIKTRTDLMRDYQGLDRPPLDVAELIAEQKRMEAIVGIVEVMGKIYLAQPKAGAQSPVNGWDEKRYRKAQTVLATYGARWLRTGSLGFKAMREVHPTTVAFLMTIGQLAGIQPVASAMSLTMTRRKTEVTVAETAVLA